MKTASISNPNDVCYPFSKEWYDDPYILYHGTSHVYSESIEKNGWNVNEQPYEIDDFQNICKLFEDIGWDALCIEPNIEHKESLTAHRKFVRYYACGKENKELPLHIFRVGKDDITSSLTSLSPDERLVEDHKEIINDSYKVDVKVRTLNWILENETSDTPFENVVDIDFISIDTEGTELDVIKGLDFDKYSVKLLIIENNYNDDNIEEYMNLMGYKKDKRYKINDFYIKHEENKI